MNIPFVDLKKQYHSIKREIDNSISKVINNTAFIGGEEVDSFETNYAEKYGVENCISVANGTDAIYIALKMLGIGRGDEVITTALSWISTSETISQTGAKPVFVDVDPQYYTIDEDKIEEKITSKTKAILPVHIYGQSANMDKIKQICEQHDLYLIEDCAQAHFTKYKDKYVGLFGDAGTFSFYPGKNLGAYGDAGCIISNDDSLSKKMRMFANHGALQKHAHVIEGINSRLDGLQAAVLNVKLKYISKWTEQRKENAQQYSNLLSDVGDLILPKIRPSATHTFHLYVIRTNYRDKLIDFLERNGISTSIHYPSILPLLPAYDYLNHSPKDFPNGSKIHKQILSIPMFPELTEKQISYVSETIKSFYKDLKH